MDDKQIAELRESIKADIMAEIEANKKNKHMVGPYADIRKKYQEPIIAKFSAWRGYKIIDSCMQIMKHYLNVKYIRELDNKDQAKGARFLEHLYKSILDYEEE